MRNGNGRQMHINSLLQKLGPWLTVFNRIYRMLDKRSLLALVTLMVLPYHTWIMQMWSGGICQLKSKSYITEETIAAFSKSLCKLKIVKAKVISAETLALLRWNPLHARRIGHRCCLVQDMHWRENSLNTSRFSILKWANSTVIILEMVTCPKSAGREWNGAETKHT